MVEFRFCLWGWLACMPMLAFAQEVRMDIEVAGMEGRAYRWSEVLPLTRVKIPVDSGSVSVDGRVTLCWPNDGLLRTYALECAGVEWILPVCGPAPQGHRLVPPTSAGAPFSTRPGAVLADSDVDPWLPLVLADLDDAIREIEAALEVELQRALLWGSSAQRGGESEALGASTEAGGPQDVDVDALRAIWMAELATLQDSVVKGQPEPVRQWMVARLDAIRSEVDAKAGDRVRRAWQNMPAPDPSDAAAILRFVEGADRYASVVELADSLAESYAIGLGTADWESLVDASAGWWGTRDPDKTAAWCAHRLGRDAFGVRRPGAPFSVRAWTPEWALLIDRLGEHPMYGDEIRSWQKADAPVKSLPKTLRAMNVSETPVDLEELVGSGPAIWLWLDASAPSTTVQLQVLERMMADPASKQWPRGLQWVVADAGTNWPAFQALVRKVTERFGGVSKVPFALIHTGGDLRWTQSFGLSVLPAVRHHGPELVPVAADLPLPGPELSRWLAKRP